MKFTTSPTIPLTVLTSTLILEQDNNTMHVGTTVWPCSLVLVKFLERWSIHQTTHPDLPNPYEAILRFADKRTIELGTGCGPLGMGLHLLGSSNIILTDINPVMPALKHNLKKNKATLGRNLKTKVLDWSNTSHVEAMGKFDVVVAADVVYIEESVKGLVNAMEMLVKDDGVVLLGYQVRCKEADVLFWELCGDKFGIEKVPKEDLHVEYAYEEADVYVMRKKKGE